VDGSPRVSCVTPARRVAGRKITTLDGLDPELRSVWTAAFTEVGASQCGFCTPGIIMRLAALIERKPAATHDDVGTALLAHLCRCTGWRTIFEAALLAQGDSSQPAAPRDLQAASRRAEIEGRCAQFVGPDVTEGRGGFADDSAPAGSLVAVPDGADGWAVAGTLTEARTLARKVQGRNSGVKISWPVELPDGDWSLTLQTTFVEPAYLEPDASWCEPGGEAVSPIANGGAFGGKLHSVVTSAARALADEHSRPVRVLLGREDVVRMGPKRPPIAVGMRSDGSGGCVRVGRTPGSGDLGSWIEGFLSYAPGFEVEVVDILGPPVSSDVRGAGWVEAAVVMAALAGADSPHANPVAPSADPVADVTTPEGGRARVTISEGTIHVQVDAGEVLDEIVLRSYCIGAVHQALGWVRREAVALDAAGQVLDLTIRSFRIVPAREMPQVEVVVVASLLDEGGSTEGAGMRPAVNASDAVFAATAAAAWIAAGLVPRWPIET